MSDESNSASGNRGWLPGATAILTFIACNGLFILVAILSVFGITIVINPHIQAGVISLFAALTLAFVFAGYKAHGVRRPLVMAVIGAVLVIGSMYIYFNKIIESVGLLALIVSAIWSWRANRENAGAA